jgi:TPR repeat protein
MIWTTVLAAALVCLLGMPSGVSAQEIDAANAAYEAGDYTTAARLWLALAEQGNSEAQTLVGLSYFAGRGLPQNFPEAERWLRLAAEQGNARAQANLGPIYFNGVGIARNYVEAIRWYRLAAEQGHVVSQLALGLIFYNGTVVPRDLAESARWLSKAAEQGSAAGQENLAVMYLTGAGVVQNFAEAERLLRLAVAQNSEEARLALLNMQMRCQTTERTRLWQNLNACMTMDEVSAALSERGVRTRILNAPSGEACAEPRDEVQVSGVEMRLSLECNEGRLKRVVLTRNIPNVNPLSHDEYTSTAQTLARIYGRPVATSNPSMFDRPDSPGPVAGRNPYAIFRAGVLDIRISDQVFDMRSQYRASSNLKIEYTTVHWADYEADELARRTQADQEARNRRESEGL